MSTYTIIIKRNKNVADMFPFRFEWKVESESKWTNGLAFTKVGAQRQAERAVERMSKSKSYNVVYSNKSTYPKSRIKPDPNPIRMKVGG